MTDRFITDPCSVKRGGGTTKYICEKYRPMSAYAFRAGWHGPKFFSICKFSTYTKGPFYIMIQSSPGGSVVRMSDSWPGGCVFDPPLKRTFFPANFRLLPLQKYVRKVVGSFGKKSCVSTGVRKPGRTYMCVNDRHDMTLAVKIALNPIQSINQHHDARCLQNRFYRFVISLLDGVNVWRPECTCRAT